jgi:hypothetical protein
MTVQDLYDKFGLAMKDISDVGSIWYMWVNNLNNFYYRITQSLEPELYFVETSYGSSGTYTLPVDFENIGTGEAGLFLVDDNGKMEGRIVPCGIISNRLGFRLSGGNIIINELPSNKTAKLIYIPKLLPITEMTDSVVLDDTWVSQNIEALKRMYYEWDKNGAQETNADARLNRDLSELIAGFRRSTKAVVLK